MPMPDDRDGDTLAELDPYLDLLADRDVWAEASPELSGRIVAAVAAERAHLAVEPSITGTRLGSSRLVHIGGALLAGAAAALLAVGAISLLRAPDQQEVALVGAGSASDITGSVDVLVVDSGVRLQLRAAGLPRRDGGQFYEGWLKNCDGSLLVPIGTFHDLDDATGWAGVSLDQFPLLTVTTESATGPKDPLQGSSGDVVLTAQVGTPCPGS
jgi:hypothetical protein